MKHFAIALFISLAITKCLAQGTEKEKVVKDYYSGFEKHDWNIVVSQFTNDFKFTSPNNDDHIPIEKYKEKCWGTNKYFKSVHFIKMAESGNTLFLLVEIITTDDKVVRNVDVFNFEGVKIKSIETFFGPGRLVSG